MNIKRTESRIKNNDTLVVELQSVVEQIKLDYPAAAATVAQASIRLGQYSADMALAVDAEIGRARDAEHS